MMYAYLTVNQTIETTLIIKKSRFTCLLYPAQNEDELNNCLNQAKEQYPRANHYCYAAIFNHPNPVERFSDGGEPSGTAGKPILAVLRGGKLTNIAAVVVRYFGGTLLGKGGLVKAYSDTVQETITQAQIVTMMPSCKINIVLDYPYYNQFINKLQPILLGQTEPEFADKIIISAHIPLEIKGEFKKRLIELCHAQYEESEIGYFPTLPS